MRAVNIIALVVVIIMSVVAGYYIDEVSSARWQSFFSDYDYGYGSYGGGYYGPSASSLTQTAGGLMLVFVLFFTFAYIGNLTKIKTTTSKVMSIIGLSFTLIILLINFGTLADPGGLSFDETGAFFVIYGIINLAFFIVLLVQSVKYFNRQNGTISSNSDVLDIEIE